MVLFLALNGYGVVQEEAMEPVKIIPGKDTSSDRQTIYFELPCLPGQIFRLIIPELISDAEDDPLPWGHASPERWEIGKNRASYRVVIEGVIRAEVEVLFKGERIEARVSVTNLSERVWRHSNAFTCLLLKGASLFSDPQLARTHVPVGDDWKPLSELFRETSTGNAATFCKVKGGSHLKNLWVCREITNHCPRHLSHGSICVASKDAQWVVGMTSPDPAYVFNNPGLPCIHADPLLGTIEPGATAEGVSVIHVFRGTVEDFAERCGADL